MPLIVILRRRRLRRRRKDDGEVHARLSVARPAQRRGPLEVVPGGADVAFSEIAGGGVVVDLGLPVVYSEDGEVVLQGRRQVALLVEAQGQLQLDLGSLASFLEPQSESESKLNFEN